MTRIPDYLIVCEICGYKPPYDLTEKVFAPKIYRLNNKLWRCENHLEGADINSELKESVDRLHEVFRKRLNKEIVE